MNKLEYIKTEFNRLIPLNDKKLFKINKHIQTFNDFINYIFSEQYYVVFNSSDGNFEWILDNKSSNNTLQIILELDYTKDLYQIYTYQYINQFA